MEEHKKKICFVSPNIYKLFNKNSNVKYGGSEVQIYLISKELSEKSISIEVSVIIVAPSAILIGLLFSLLF